MAGIRHSIDRANGSLFCSRYLFFAVKFPDTRGDRIPVQNTKIFNARLERKFDLDVSCGWRDVCV